MLHPRLDQVIPRGPVRGKADLWRALKDRAMQSRAIQGRGDQVIVAYRPKPGQAAALEAIVTSHVPRLRAWGLATDRPQLIMRAEDGTLVEAFEWKPEAVEAANKDTRILAMWEEFAIACDIVTLRDLAETADMFATFVAVD